MEVEKNENLPTYPNSMDTHDEGNLKMAEITLAAAINCSVCPVCFETLMPPIYQCCNGHIICSNCVERLDKCVECRGALSPATKIRNIALEKILSNLCVDCTNKNEGCEAKSTVEWLRNHLQVCPFTPFSLCSNLLGWKNCEYKVNDSSVVSHLEGCHSVTKVHSNTFRLCLNVSKIPEDGHDFFFEPLMVTSMEVPLLIRSVVSTDGYFTFTGFLLKNNLDDLQSIRLKFRVQSQSSKVEWSGYVQSYRTFKETHIINSFRIPVDSLLEFWGPPTSLSQENSAIIINVFVWQTSALSQEDRIEEEVHIFEQSQFPKNVPGAERAAARTFSPLTQTLDGSQSQNEGSEEYLNIFYSPFENGNSSFRE